MNPREERAMQMIIWGRQPKAVSEEKFIVPSQFTKKKYVVVKREEWKCNCPDFKYRHDRFGVCKHIYTIQFWQKLRGKIDDLEEIEIGVIKKEICVYCGSDKLIKRGIRKTSIGEKQRYSCKDCNRRFVLEPIQKIKGDAKTITVVMDLYFKGLSLRQIKDHLKQFYDLEVAHNTILNWIQRFTKILNDYTDKLKIKGSGEWSADETAHYQNWVWNIMDKNTKFLLSSNVERFKFKETGDRAFKDAKTKTIEEPDSIKTDGYMGYPIMIKENFPNTTHIRDCGISKEQHNAEIERLQGSQKDRTRNMRGFGSLEGSQIFHDGWRNYYNFIKPHNSLMGLTPAQMSGLNLKFGQNKWLTLLLKALE